uniref:Uncharacterized protein n=1 Tax=Wuchereria bancrofti TaxID=6293 RepID=A0AAF5RVQ0_WUCBA
MENIESQLDFIFSIGSPRTNFSSQNVSSTGNQENDDLIITPGVETDSESTWKVELRSTNTNKDYHKMGQDKSDRNFIFKGDNRSNVMELQQMM